MIKSLEDQLRALQSRSISNSDSVLEKHIARQTDDIQAKEEM